MHTSVSFIANGISEHRTEPTWDFNFFWTASGANLSHFQLVDTMGPLGLVFNTPSHHRVHHGRNPYCIDKNYGGVFIIWDKVSLIRIDPLKAYLLSDVQHLRSRTIRRPSDLRTRLQREHIQPDLPSVPHPLGYSSLQGIHKRRQRRARFPGNRQQNKSYRIPARMGSWSPRRPVLPLDEHGRSST